jgi:hypothetical protein
MDTTAPSSRAAYRFSGESLLCLCRSRSVIRLSTILDEAIRRNKEREAFKAGFTVYVGLNVNRYPDAYWNPRAGHWVTLTKDQWDIADRGLPQTEINYPPESFFDQLTEMWKKMAPNDADKAYWSPAQKRWLLATPKSTTPGVPGPGGAQKEQEQWLVHLHELYVKGIITWPVYQRAVADALAGRPPTIAP